MSRRGVLAAGLAVVALVSSAAATSVLEKGELDYREGRVADAEAKLKPLIEKKDKDYPRYLLSLSTVELSLGDYQRGEQFLAAAVENLSLGATATGLGMLKSESARSYRGFPHEKVLAHTYLGLAYFQQQKYNDARIEYAKAREEQRGGTVAQESDFTTVEFLDGINAMRDGRLNDAQVSFRKVTEIRKGWPLGWLALCRASELDHDATEAAEAWGKYESLSDPGSRLARDGSTPCALFLIDAGWGPTRKDEATSTRSSMRAPKGDSSKVIARWERTPSDQKIVRLAVMGQPRLDAAEVDDLYYQASTTGGLLRELAGELARRTLSDAVQAIPGAGLFTGKSGPDLRCWGISPGTIHLAALPIPPSPSTVELTCYDSKGNAIDKYRQVFRYIGGQPFDRAPVIYARILPNADERATLHSDKN